MGKHAFDVNYIVKNNNLQNEFHFLKRLTLSLINEIKLTILTEYLTCWIRY